MFDHATQRKTGVARSVMDLVLAKLRLLERQDVHHCGPFMMYLQHQADGSRMVFLKESDQNINDEIHRCYVIV